MCLILTVGRDIRLIERLSLVLLRLRFRLVGMREGGERVVVDRVVYCTLVRLLLFQHSVIPIYYLYIHYIENLGCFA